MIYLFAFNGNCLSLADELLPQNISSLSEQIHILLVMRYLIQFDSYFLELLEFDKTSVNPKEIHLFVLSDYIAFEWRWKEKFPVVVICFQHFLLT